MNIDRETVKVTIKDGKTLNRVDSLDKVLS
jgi:hypothetical protein